MDPKGRQVLFTEQDGVFRGFRRFDFLKLAVEGQKPLTVRCCELSHLFGQLALAVGHLVSN